MAKSIGPADDPGAGPAAQVDQPVQTGFNVDAFDGLKKISRKILQFQGQCYKTFDHAPQTANIRLGWNGLPGTNAQAYYKNS